jgi:flagellar hook-associated protein 1 FlgK
MGTISSAFSIISGALDADQAALNVVSNNVANANTTGYTEEVANFSQNQSIDVNGTSYGDGATETGSTSLRDRVLEQRLDQQQQLASASSTRLTALDSIQGLFTPDSGSTTSSTAGDIGSDITSFYDSFSSLESEPTSSSARLDVLSTAKTLASDISSAATNLNTQRAGLDEDTTGVVSQVNSLTTSIAQLNLQIQAASPSAASGTLEDQRQADLSSLSKLIGINQVTTADNGVQITTTSGQLLIAGGVSNQLTSGTVNGVTDYFVGSTDVTSQLTSGGGELGGYLTARDQDIPNAISSLDQLAYSISTTVNAQNNKGTDGDSVTGSTSSPLYIFNEPTTVAGSAVNMSVVMTDANQVAAAGAGEGTGDGSNAVDMYNLSKQTIVDGQTPSNYYSSFVSSLGSTVSGVSTESTAQAASVTQLQTQNDSLSSVNLDDEASTMTTLERSYQAASQVFTIINSVITSALNLGDATAVS